MGAGGNVHGIMVPHVPPLIEYEMDHKPSQVVGELKYIGRKMKEWGVEAVVIADTHWQTRDKFFIDDSSFHRTVMSYHGFRGEIEYDVAGYPELAGVLLEAAERNLVFPGVEKHGADHAITIPLHFMFPKKDVPVVPLSIAGTPLCAFRWGRTMGETLRHWGGKVLFVASGSLSHDLDSFSRGLPPAKYKEFDRQVLKLLSEGNGMDVLSLNPDLIDAAKSEGNFRDLYMLLGVIGSQTRGHVRAYENLSGIGMGVVEFIDSGYDEGDGVLLRDYYYSDLFH
ncbi:MAG TPA: hypothetical protein VMW83_00335 [Spirochaetia bacterium]|nr:hypothetical protein [Spirochaetia bacterium]